MKLVIDIDEKAYSKLLLGKQSCCDEGNMLVAIANGTVLPKGHGDLKYIDAFKYWCETNEENGVITIPKFICDNIIKILDNAPTIVKADKGEQQ